MSLGNCCDVSQARSHGACVSALQEGEQIRVQPILMREGQAVRGAFVDFHRGGREKLRDRARGEIDRHDLIVAPVDDERRTIELLHVLAEILRERDDAIVAALESSHHALLPPRIDLALRKLSSPAD